MACLAVIVVLHDVLHDVLYLHAVGHTNRPGVSPLEGELVALLQCALLTVMLFVVRASSGAGYALRLHLHGRLYLLAVTGMEVLLQSCSFPFCSVSIKLVSVCNVSVS